MTIGRTYTKERLKEMLNTRMAEYQMLSKTLIEMIEKGSSEVNINLLKAEIQDVQMNIEALKDWIKEKVEQETTAKEVKKAECKSLFDNVKKESCSTNNLYDSIKKQTKSISEEEKCTNNDFVSNDNKLNYEDEYRINNQILNDYPLKDQYADITYSNRFLVRFNGVEFDIPEWYVRKVSFLDSNRKEMIIGVFDFVDMERNRPIIADILGMVNNSYAHPFSIAIDHLDPIGKVLYTERYHNCRIKDVYRDNLDYRNGNINTIDMTITYSDVSYEANHS